MGGSVWRYLTDYQTDVAAALRQLQAEVLASGEFHQVYKDKAEALAAIAARIAACQTGKHAASGLNRHLVELWQTELERVRRLPDDPQTCAQAIKQQRAFCAEAGTHSILDMHGVSPTPAPLHVSPFSAPELRRIFFTEQPNAEQLKTYSRRLPSIDDEWRGYYFTIYRREQPDKLCFYGSSGD